MHQLVGLINQARTNPERTGVTIHNYLQHKFQDNYLNAYDKRIDTFEGINVLHDLRNYLCSIRPAGQVVQSVALNKAAQIIAQQKGKQGSATHEKPRIINQRVQAISRLQGKVGQLISLSAYSAEEVTTYFLLDDGLATRKRRRMLLDPQYKFIGVGSAPHNQYGNIVVILLAEYVGQ